MVNKLATSIGADAFPEAKPAGIENIIGLLDPKPDPNADKGPEDGNAGEEDNNPKDGTADEEGNKPKDGTGDDKKDDDDAGT